MIDRIRFSSVLAIPPGIDEQLRPIFKEREASIRMYFGELQKIHGRETLVPRTSQVLFPGTFLDVLNIKEMVLKLGTDDGNPLPPASIGYLE